MARSSSARAFRAAVEEAHAAAVAMLRASLTCGCVPPPHEAVTVVGLANLSPPEFLAELRAAALLGGTTIGLVEGARLKSWAHAFGEGWGPGGAGHYQRRSLEELVDKIDLDVPAGDDKEDDGWLADAKDEHETSEELRETPAPKKRRAGALMDELDAGDDDDKSDSATGMGTSGKRERKRSKYLSPPYTNLGAAARMDDRKRSKYLSLPDGIVAEEVLSLVLDLAKDVSHGSRFPKVVEGFLCSFRSREFKCPEAGFYEVHESPVAHAVGKVDVDITAMGAVSDEQTVQGNCAAKRSRRKDEEWGTSSIKRKKREKHFPAASIGCDLPITPAIPIRQMRAEDIRGQMKVGGGARFLGVGVRDEKFKPSVFKCEVSPAVPEATKSGKEQVTVSDQLAKENDETKLRDEKNEPSLFKCAIPAAALEADKSRQEQQVVGFAGKMALAVDSTFSDQSAKNYDEAKFGDGKSEQSVFKCPVSDAVPGATKPVQEQVHQNDVSADNTLSDQSVKENSLDMVAATKSEMNVESVPVVVPIKSVQIEATGSETKVFIDESVQNVVADLLVANVQTEARGPEAKVCVDERVQSVVADLPVTNVSREATKTKPNVCIDETVVTCDAGVPVQNTVANDTLVQNDSAEVPVQSLGTDVRVSSEPSPMDGHITQAIDENRGHSSGEMHTVQQSYASLQAMVPEMLNKVTSMNGTDVIPVNHALKNELQKDEQPNHKAKLSFGSMANHFSGQDANVTCPHATNSAPKKKKRKPTQLLVDPAEIIVEFTPGVILPSREELLSAFSKFGFVIESQTNIVNATRSARVVFGKKAEAENAYKQAGFLGEFGPPFATLKLGDLPPIELSAPSPPRSVSSRPPLTNIRKNLEKMILARHSSLKTATSTDGPNPASDKLLADMQGLLAQVDKMLSGPSAPPPP
jgi:hypothetical protein